MLILTPKAPKPSPGIFDPERQLFRVGERSISKNLLFKHNSNASLNTFSNVFSPLQASWQAHCYILSSSELKPLRNGPCATHIFTRRQPCHSLTLQDTCICQAETQSFSMRESYGTIRQSTGSQHANKAASKALQFANPGIKKDRPGSTFLLHPSP